MSVFFWAGAAILALGSARYMAEGSILTRQNRLVATGLAVLLPLIALSLYLILGSPNEGDQPLSERLDKPVEELSLDALRIKIEARAKAAPDDVEAWRILARLYQQSGANDRAITALYRLLDLGQEDVSLYLSLADNYLALGSDADLTNAIKMVAKANSLEPQNLRVRFYEGLLQVQQGETQSAIAIWRALLTDLPPGIPFRNILESRISELQNSMHKGGEEDGS